MKNRLLKNIIFTLNSMQKNKKRNKKKKDKNKDNDEQKEEIEVVEEIKKEKKEYIQPPIVSHPSQPPTITCEEINSGKLYASQHKLFEEEKVEEKVEENKKDKKESNEIQ